MSSTCWPASVFQQTLMAAEQLLPGGSTGPYMTMTVSARVVGPLELTVLDRAYDDLVARNEVLRTTMVADGDTWLQQVHPHRTVHLMETDGHGRTPEELDRSWTATAIPADQPPLVRGHVARLDDGTHVVGLTIHHLHTDPRSLDLAISELGTLYTARLVGEPVPPPPLQFGPYVHQQNEMVVPRRNDDLEFWRTTLLGAEPMAFAPDLTRDWSRPPKTGTFRAQLLGADEAATLERWALRHRTTFFGALFTGFSLALADRLDNRDVLASTVFEQRDQTTAGTMIGPFIHTALLRVRVPAESGWESLAPQVRDVVLAAYAHAHVPTMEVLGLHLDLLQKLARQPAGLCVFQYVPSHAAAASIRFGEARATVLTEEKAGPTGDVGLMFRLHRRPDGSVLARVTYDERDLDEPLAREVLGDFGARLAEPLTRTLDAAAR